MRGNAVAEVGWSSGDLESRRLWSMHLSDGDRRLLRDDSLSGTWNAAKPVRETLRIFVQRTIQAMGLALISNAVDTTMPEDSVLRCLSFAVGDFGHLIPQTPRGALFEILRDKAGDGATELAFHTDSSDILVLLCLQPAAGDGGETKLASARHVFDIIKEERPDLLATLQADWQFDRRGRPGPQMIVRPIFSKQPDGTVGCYHSPRTARATPAMNGTQLTKQQADALDLLDEVLSRPEVEFRLAMSRGDLLLVLNSRIIHGRTAFVDEGGPAAARRMLRLWLQMDPAGQRTRASVDRRTNR